MGQILSQPVTEKHSENAGDNYVAYGLSSMQGWRINMEDDHSTILNMAKVKDYQPDIEQDKIPEESKPHDNDVNQSQITTSNKDDEQHVSFFGVYDGHGGERAAIFTGEHLHQIIKSTKAFKSKDYGNALKDGFLNCDQAILRDFNMRDDDSGCAATSVIITPEQIYCGNAGDSRTVMSINGFAKALSYDHKPSNEGEKTRICSAGGYVDMGRVKGNLALSRGIGDFEFKKNLDLPAEEQIVTCYPDVITHNINFDNDEFIILACDGIWDCLTSQSCVECVRRGIFERKELTVICEEIMELCCAPTSDGSGIGCDNMSIVIVALLDYTKNETLDQWYEKVIHKIEISQSTDANASKYAPISNPYNVIYKDIYGQYYEIGQQAQNTNSRTQNGGLGGYSMFGGLPGLRNQQYNDDDDDEINNNNNNEGNAHDEDKDAGNVNEESEVNGAISLQKLLASNAITSENGVIYLDTSSAQSLLAHYGIQGSEDVNFEDVEDIEHESGHSNNDDVHEKHIEEDIDKDFK